MGFKGVYKKLKGFLKKVSKVFQGCFNEILRVFQGRLGGVHSPWGLKPAAFYLFRMLHLLHGTWFIINLIFPFLYLANDSQFTKPQNLSKFSKMVGNCK